MKYQYTIAGNVYTIDVNNKSQVAAAIKDVKSKANAVSADLDYLKRLLSQGVPCGYRIADLLEELNHLKAILKDLEKFNTKQPEPEN